MFRRVIIAFLISISLFGWNMLPAKAQLSLAIELSRPSFSEQRMGLHVTPAQRQQVKPLLDEQILELRAFSAKYPDRGVSSSAYIQTGVRAIITQYNQRVFALLTPIQRVHLQSSWPQVTFSLPTETSIDTPDVSAISSEQIVALHKAIDDDDMAMVRRLVQQTPSIVNQPDSDNNPPLYYAITERSTSSGSANDIANYLINHGANVSWIDTKHHSLLYLGVSKGSLPIPLLITMLHNGADPNVADNLGQTPLFVAIGPGYVQSLLHAGARTDVVDQNGNTPLIVNLLGLNTALYNGTLYDNVFARVEDWKATTSAILHSPKPNINQTNKVGDTALTYTESHDQLHYLVRPLIALGANVKVKDNDGKSILWFLKFPGDQAIAKYAVSHGVSVIDTDNSGTPLLNAIVSRGDYQYGDYAYVLFLLAHGAQVNREDNHGTRPLDIATKQANGQMIDLIKQHGGKTD